MIHPEVESEESPSVKLNLCAPLTSTYTMCRLLRSRAQQGSARGGSGGLRFRGGEQLRKSSLASKSSRTDPFYTKSRTGNRKKGTYEVFKYAPLEEVDKHLRPLLAEEEMDLSYSDEAGEGGGIVIRGRLKHLPGG